MPHVSEIQIRDPFVVPDARRGTYHLFGTTDKDCWNTGVGFDTYHSRDLVHWDGADAGRSGSAAGSGRP
jgi:hypothetical protein